MLWLTQMMCYNAYIPLRQMNDAEENLQFLMSLIRPSFSANYSMHEMLISVTCLWSHMMLLVYDVTSYYSFISGNH